MFEHIYLLRSLKKKHLHIVHRNIGSIRYITRSVVLYVSKDDKS